MKPQNNLAVAATALLVAACGGADTEATDDANAAPFFAVGDTSFNWRDRSLPVSCSYNRRTKVGEGHSSEPIFVPRRDASLVLTREGTARVDFPGVVTLAVAPIDSATAVSCSAEGRCDALWQESPEAITLRRLLKGKDNQLLSVVQVLSEGDGVHSKVITCSPK